MADNEAAARCGPAPRSRPPGFWHATLNGELRLVNERGIEHGSHAHLSAVAVLREQPTDSGYPAVTLDVFETISDHCVPLRATHGIRAPGGHPVGRPGARPVRPEGLSDSRTYRASNSTAPGAWARPSV